MKRSKFLALTITGMVMSLGLLYAPFIGSYLFRSIGCSLGKVNAQDNPCLQQEATLSALGFQATLVSVNLRATIAVQATQIATLRTVKPPIAITPIPPTSTPGVDAFIPDEAMTGYQPIYDAGFKAGKLDNGLYFLGSETAPVLVEQFSSYSCPHCRAYHESVIVNLFDKIAAGQVKFVFVPLAHIGSFDSTQMARATLCAGEQDRYWEMNDIMFDWQERYGSSANDLDRLTEAARKLDLNTKDFKACMNNPAIQAVLDNTKDDATARGLIGTPTIYIDGQTAPDSTAPGLEELRSLIEKKVASHS